MLIQCTKKLLDQLKIKPEEVQETTDSLFCWHANLLKIGRKNTVVLVNDHNRYIVVLYGLLAKDFKKLDDLIFEAIREVFQEEQINDEMIDQFLQQSPTVTFTKTKDRTSVARMNRSIDSFHSVLDLLEHDAIIQTQISKRISRFLVGHGDKAYIEPHVELYRDLENLTGQKALRLQAVKVKVTLLVNNFKVWRRLIIPLHINFRDLHNILQKS